MSRKTHELKTETEYFNEVVSGNKNFELRKNDRDFKVGDYLMLQDYNKETKTYTGRIFYKTISYVLENAPQFGLKEGYCILSLI